jgi:dihydrofolate reductase
MTRPKTSAFVGASLDGFLARPDGRIDWLDRFAGEEHGYAAFMATVDTLVVGSNTYAFVLEMARSQIGWPYEGKRCVVMTHRPIDGGHGERAYAGEPGPLLDELGAGGARHVYVDGGVVIRRFIAAGLLDEMTVSFVPSLIGAGIPLFGGVAVETGIVLDRAVTHPSGVLQARYRFTGSAS